MSKHLAASVAAMLLALVALQLAGCKTTSAPEERAALHGPPLTEAAIVSLAREASSPDDVAIEARLRGFAFPWTSEAERRLNRQGVSRSLTDRLATIAAKPDTLGNQPRPELIPGAVLGGALVTAAAAGLVWLWIELVDDADRIERRVKSDGRGGFFEETIIVGDDDDD